MSAGLPERVDAWRMVAQRRSFHGSVALANFPRLRELLVDARGEVRYEIDFGFDPHSQPFVSVCAEAGLRLACQRTLEPFVWPVSVQTRLGLIRSEREEAALPQGYEAYLVPEDGALVLLDLIEDELLLEVPAVPLSPDVGGDEGRVWSSGAEVEAPPDNPFAALKDWKKH